MSEMIKQFRENTFVTKEFNDFLQGFIEGASGDVDIVITPAMTGAGGDEVALEPTVAEANDDYTATVKVEVKNDAGDVLKFYNGTLEAKAVVTSTAGTAKINDGAFGVANANVTADLKFDDGVLEFTVTLGGTWAENDTLKITIDDANVGILGYTVEKNNHFLIDVDANPA